MTEPNPLVGKLPTPPVGWPRRNSPHPPRRELGWRTWVSDRQHSARGKQAGVGVGVGGAHASPRDSRRDGPHGEPRRGARCSAVPHARARHTPVGGSGCRKCFPITKRLLRTRNQRAAGANPSGSVKGADGPYALRGAGLPSNDLLNFISVEFCTLAADLAIGRTLRAGTSILPRQMYTGFFF